MISILLATPMEARPLLERLDARKCPKKPFETHAFDASADRPAGTVVISGMGMERAASAAQYAIRDLEAQAVLNVGICGALNGNLRTGTALRVNLIVDGNRVLADEAEAALDCSGVAWASLPTYRLATVGEGVFEESPRLRLAERADVVDMEGYAIARVCKEQGVVCHFLKGVSDLANRDGKADIQKNIDAVSRQLAELVVPELGRWRAPSGIVSKVLNFAKVEHTIFSLPLLFAGAWLGAGRLWPLGTLALIALAGVGARVVAMAMNRIFDRKLDALNKRTAGRELPSGRMSLAAAYGVVGVGLAAYLAACAALGPLCLKLAPVPLVPLVGYSLLKRFTSLCHFGVGVCLGLAPLGAFVAASGGLDFSREVVLLSVFTFFWISGFDIIYALQDIESDRETGVHSIPAKLGCARAQLVAAACHLVAFGALAWLWFLTGRSALSGLALMVAAGAFLLAYWPRVPLPTRFFPISAVAGVAGALVLLLGGIG